jgi:hypothetical protein
VLEVDLGDPAEDDPGVLLVGQDLARGRGDLALAQDAGGHLVEQRLEEVVGRLADQGDVDVGPLESLGPEQSAETRADHDDLVTLACGFVGCHRCLSNPTGGPGFAGVVLIVVKGRAVRTSQAAEFRQMGRLVNGFTQSPDRLSRASL